jgi:predicted kinase
VGKIVRSRLPWRVHKAEFVRRRVDDGENLSLAQFAAELGVDRRTVERHASDEAWLAAIEARTQARLDAAYDARIINTLYNHLKRSTFRAR